MAGISLFLSSVALSVVIKRKITDSLLPISCLFMLVGYALALVGYLSYWRYLSVLLLLCACIVILRNRKNLAGVISVGGIAFAVCCGIVFILCRKILVTSWDDLNHWAVITKQIYYIKAVPIDEISVSGFSDYPPMAAIWFNLFLCDFSIYREDLLFGLWNILLGMCILPFWELIRRENKWYQNCLVAIMCVLLPFAMAYTSFSTLQVDWLVALITLYVLCRVIDIDEASWIDVMLLGSVLCALTLVKAVAIAMAFECLIVLAIILLIKKAGKREIIAFLITLVALLGAYFSWKIFCIIGENSSYINSEFNSKGAGEYLESFLWLIRSIPWWVALSLVVSGVVIIMLLKGLYKRGFLAITELINCVFTVIMCETNLYSWRAMEGSVDSFEYIGANYWNAFCHWGVNSDVAVSSFTGLSTLETITLSVLVLAMLGNWGKRRDNTKVIVGTLSVFFVVFCVSHLSMYLYLFVGGERDTLSAYNRYLSLVLFPFVGVVVYLAARAFIEDVRDIKSMILSVIIVALMINYRYALIQFYLVEDTGSYFRSGYDNRTMIEQMTDEISEVVAVDGNRSYCVILGGVAGSYDHYMRYLLMPARLSGYLNCDNYSEEEIIESLNDQCYDYVFVYMPVIGADIDIANIVKSTEYSEVAVTDSGFMILQNIWAQ